MIPLVCYQPLPGVSIIFLILNAIYWMLIERRCWNGKDLDSPDHQSHMYNTITMDGFTNAPKCPASHPVRMPQVAYETVWDTRQFNSRFVQPPAA